YVRTSDEPAGRFDWWRARMLGGRTNHWGRISLRNGPYDFKPHSRDRLGFDWPIAYEDVAPYYDKVELLIGVYGSNEGLENTPDSSPGCLLPPPRPLVSDLLMAQRAKRLGIAAIPGHKAVLTRPLDFRSSPARLHPGSVTAQKILAEDMRARAVCLWATPCGRGCSIRANYQSTTVHLPPALASGNLDITTDAMVYEVTLGRDGRADGVSFIDRTTGKPQHARARNRGGHGMADRRQLWAEAQTGRAPLLRLLRPLRRPRRNDPQRALLLRDRSERQGQVGHPGASVSLAMVGARAATGRTHAKDLRRNRRRHGRAHSRPGAERRRQGHRSRRLDHPRSRWRDHGIGP